MNIKKRILITSGLYVIVAIASIITPRFVARSMDGLGAVGAASGSFLILGVLAIIIALVALVMVFVGWKRLPQPIRMAGLAPMVITMIAAIVIIVLIGKQPSHMQTQSPRMEPKTMPAPTSQEAQTPQRHAENE